MICANLYIELDILCIIILIMLTFKTRRSMFKQRQRVLFTTLLISNIFFIFSDMVWIFNNGYVPFNGSYAMLILIWIGNTLNVFLPTLSAFSWVLFSEHVQESNVMTKPKTRWIVAIPMCLMFLVAITNTKTHFMFNVDENGQYTRGIGYVLELIISYSYLLWTAIRALIKSKKVNNYQQKQRLRTLAGFVIAPLITGALQLVISGMSILFVGVLFSILIVYLSLQEQLISIDPLTQLKNRSFLAQRMEECMASWNGKKELYIMIMDINYFKKINDTFGHVEGDRALILLSDVLKKICTARTDFLCRYGGDEFIILHETNKGGNTIDVEKQIHESLAKLNLPYPLEVSIGSARYVPNIKDWQDFIKVADAKMYEIKKKRKPFALPKETLEKLKRSHQ